VGPLLAFVTSGSAYAQNDADPTMTRGLEIFVQTCGAAMGDLDVYIARLSQRSAATVMHYGNTADSTMLTVLSEEMTETEDGAYGENVVVAATSAGTSVSCHVTIGFPPVDAREVNDTFVRSQEAALPDAVRAGGATTQIQSAPSYSDGYEVFPMFTYSLVGWAAADVPPALVTIWSHSVEMLTHRNSQK